MSRRKELSSGSYARALEQHWSVLAGRPVVLSPRDWARVSRWHAWGVPLEIVLEAMDAAAERRPGREPFFGLAALAAMVEEAWSVVVQGRLSGANESISAPPAGSADAAWRGRLDAEPRESALAEALRELLRRLDQGEPRGALDAELDDRLPELVPTAVLQEARQKVAAELEAFRQRMAPNRFQETHRRGLLERLRRHLRLPRLASDETDR